MDMEGVMRKRVKATHGMSSATTLPCAQDPLCEPMRDSKAWQQRGD